MTENSIRNVDGMNNLELPRLKITSQTHLISASPMRTFEIANNDDNITFVNVNPKLTNESSMAMSFFLINFSQYFMRQTSIIVRKKLKTNCVF